MNSIKRLLGLLWMLIGIASIIILIIGAIININLHGTADINKPVPWIIIIAVFILLLACINFMNLSTARATQRAKEVGVRKVIGANRNFNSYRLIYGFYSVKIFIDVR